MDLKDQKRNAGVSQENLKFSFSISAITVKRESCACLTRVERKCPKQVNVSRDRHVDIKYSLLVSIGLWREITYRMDSKVECRDRLQQKHRFVVDDYLCHVAPPFNKSIAKSLRYFLYLDI